MDAGPDPDCLLIEEDCGSTTTDKGSLCRIAEELEEENVGQVLKQSHEKLKKWKLDGSNPLIPPLNVISLI